VSGFFCYESGHKKFRLPTKLKKRIGC